MVTSPSLNVSKGNKTFTVEVQITSPLMDMNLCFSEYYLLLSGGLLPHETGENKTRKEYKYVCAF